MRRQSEQPHSIDGESSRDRAHIRASLCTCLCAQGDVVKWDKDGDDMISMSEFRKFVNAAGVQAEEAAVGEYHRLHNEIPSSDSHPG